MAEQTCPPLGTGSVDMSAVHDAAKAGKPLDEAIAEATTRVAPLTEAEFAELPALTGKTKADLLAIAEAEGVDVSEQMTNAAISDAIILSRAAAPVVDERGHLINPPAGDVSDDPAILGDADADHDA
jgi:hypothetical protein